MKSGLSRPESPRKESVMRLSHFIGSNMESIIQEWEVFAHGTAPGAKMDSLALRDHAKGILLATVRDMQSSQSISQQSAKSKGLGQGGTDAAVLNGDALRR